MEFWGVEVKAGEPVKCQPGENKYIHLSQAALGEVKKDKGNDSIPIFVSVGDKKLVLGTLSAEKSAHISFDLIFEREFELSHSWKHGSVYFCGYKSTVPEESDEFTDSDSDSEEEIPVLVRENGKPVVKDEQAMPATEKVKAAAKPESSTAKPKVQIAEPSKGKEEDEDDDDSDDDEDESSEDESDDDEDMVEGGGESDEDDDDEEISDDEDGATPKKAEKGKKRPIESATKTPAPEKKAKLVTPVGQKTGGAGGKKGGGHTATPYPSKQAGKTPANSNKSKPQTPKSGGQVSCKTCSKTFNSDIALQSHTKAKHSGGK
ncbi:histone deacetylase HDT1-like [Magnolia sinica]|uniref:histone deacetylase HDT1-like n=1 Tax=Magnolia sinica TaxID=86752 RepID=UPI0026595A91|nr:histone deacetylase HDT1-like [Magnolia sinica]